MSRSRLQVKEAKARSNVGVAGRSQDPERLRIARRDHAAAKLELLITDVLSSVDPLTDEQRTVLIALFTPMGGAER